MRFLQSLFLFVLVSTLVTMAQPVLTVPKDCLQLVVVRNDHWDDTVATLHCFERASSTESWQSQSKAVTVNLGRTGLAWGVSPLMPDAEYPKGALQKREGDGRSPAGLFPLLKAFGHPAPPQNYSENNLRFLLVTDEQAVDDVKSPYYNQIVRPQEVGGVTWSSAETMKIGLYQLGLVVGHNTPQAKPGFGSAIFFHLQRGPGRPTAGCTSMADADLTKLVLWLKREKNPAVLQLPKSEYADLGSGFPTIR